MDAALRRRRPPGSTASRDGRGSETPFAFYARVLGAERGRQRFLARLGHEADDALDEFLNLALDYERRETPSLQGFVAWLRAAQDRREARHGDHPRRGAGDDRARRQGPRGADRDPRRHHDAARGTGAASAAAPRCWRRMAPGAPDRFVWAGPKANDVAPVAAARERVRREAEDEYRRLLYVAMTRAIDRLVVCGAAGRAQPPGGLLVRTWSSDALAVRLSVEEPADDGDGNGVALPQDAIACRRAARAVSRGGGTAGARPPGSTATRPPSRSPRCRSRPRAPTTRAAPARRRSAGEPRRAREGAGARRAGAPAAAVAARHSARSARRGRARAIWRARPATSAPRNSESLLGQVQRVLDDPRFAELFAPGSRAEVPIVGRLAAAAPLAVSGQVDRLVVTADAVLIADYKTNRPAPRRLEDVPPAYVRQLALYRARAGPALSRTSRFAPRCVWTDVPDLMEISAAALDARTGSRHLRVRPP